MKQKFQVDDKICMNNTYTASPPDAETPRFQITTDYDVGTVLEVRDDGIYRVQFPQGQSLVHSDLALLIERPLSSGDPDMDQIVRKWLEYLK